MSIIFTIWFTPAHGHVTIVNEAHVVASYCSIVTIATYLYHTKLQIMIWANVSIHSETLAEAEVFGEVTNVFNVLVNICSHINCVMGACGTT